MISYYAGGESGARRAARAGSVLVVVDSFRASTTISLLVSRGARMVPVFDFGNSPAELSSSDIPAGATIAMSTTNGTRVIEAGRGSSAIYTGAFVNAERLASQIYTSFPESEVVVVGCGWEGRRTSEDEAAAGDILHHLRLLGAELDHRAGLVTQSYLKRPTCTLRTNTCARRLLRLGQGKYVEICLEEDTIPVAPRLICRVFLEEPKTYHGVNKIS